MYRPSPPVAPAKPFAIKAHGDIRTDDWYWLRESTNPKVIGLLEAESSYTRSVFTPLAGLQKKLYDEIAGRTPETDCSVPVLMGNWWYFKRTYEGKSYPVHCAIPSTVQPTPTAPTLPLSIPSPVPSAPSTSTLSLSATLHTSVIPAVPAPTPPRSLHGYEPPAVVPDEKSCNEIILLDENQLAEGHTYMAVGNLELSRTGNLMAYSVDTTGNEHFTLYVENIIIRDGIQRERLCSIGDVSYGIVFDSDDLIYYVKADNQDRPYQVWCHKIYPGRMIAATSANSLTSDGSEDKLVYEERDERFSLSISATRDDCYMLIDARSKTTSETLALPLNHGSNDHTHHAETGRIETIPSENLLIIQPRSEGIEYSVEHHNDTFILLTNESAPDFRIVSINEQRSTDGSTDQRELVEYKPGRRIEDMDIFNDFLAIQIRKDAISQVQVINLSDTSNVYSIEQPPAPSTCYIGANYCMGSPYLRYETTSLISPKSTYDLDLKSAIPILRKRQYIPSGYDESAYATMHLEARSYDGTLVPISIAYSRDTARDGKAPCLLYGYGAYEYSIDPAFSAARLSLLERGFVFAIAHVRGGGEMGRSWYENGKLASKPNTFHDFIACANYLVNNQWTSPERLVARGGSAGGMLMGAVANMAPELFRAIVAEVPFVDCLTTMMDPSLPLTVTEWEEWGNPLKSPDDYALMKSYSPYDNIRQGVKYPDILATCGMSDPRVGYFEPLKWVQKLRKASPESRILLMANMDGGHMGPSGRYAAWDEEAHILAFIIDSVQDKA